MDSNRESNPFRYNRFDVFNETEENFKSYQQRLENYFKLMEVPDSKKPLMLIDGLGSKHYQMLSDLTSPVVPNTKSYDVLIDILEDLLCPNEIKKQNNFGLLKQAENQSVSEFAGELKKKAPPCNFVCDSCNKSTLNTHLRLQFIAGLKDSEVRKKLMDEKETAFEKVVDLANCLESSLNKKKKNLHLTRKKNEFVLTSDKMQ